MAKPVYIVCAEASSINEDVKTLSLFNILEKLQVHKLPSPPEGGFVFVDLLRFKVATLWMREEDDNEENFDYEFYVMLPPNNMKVELNKGSLQFSAPMHRAIFDFRGMLPFQEGTGVMWVCARIKKNTESSDWIEQRFPIIVEMNNSGAVVQNVPEKQESQPV